MRRGREGGVLGGDGKRVNLHRCKIGPVKEGWGKKNLKIWTAGEAGLFGYDFIDFYLHIYGILIAMFMFLKQKKCNQLYSQELRIIFCCLQISCQL